MMLALRNNVSSSFKPCYRCQEHLQHSHKSDRRVSFICPKPPPPNLMGTLQRSTIIVNYWPFLATVGYNTQYGVQWCAFCCGCVRVCLCCCCQQHWQRQQQQQQQQSQQQNPHANVWRVSLTCVGIVNLSDNIKTLWKPSTTILKPHSTITTTYKQI